MLGKKTGGRTEGTPNKKTVLRQKETKLAAATGVTPCDVMLDNMRFAYNRAVELQALIENEDLKETEGYGQLVLDLARLREISQACAKDVANYFHAKLAAITHSGDAENPLLGPVTDEDRSKALKALLLKHPEILSDPEIKKLLK